MIEVILALWVVLIGALMALPVARATTPWGLGALVVPLGFATYLTAGLVLVVLGRFSAVGSFRLASLVAVALGGAWLSSRARRQAVSWPRVGVAVLVVAAGAALVAVAAQVVHLTRFTPDSMAYIASAGALERTGGFDPMTASVVLKRLFLIPALEAPGAWTGRGYLASAMPLISYGGLALTAWLAYEGLDVVGAPRSWRPRILAAAALFLITTNRVLFNIGYVHSHSTLALFLLLGAGLAWLAVQQQRWVLFYPAAAGFAMLPMIRAEGVIVAMLFIVPFAVEARIPGWGRWALVLAPAATALLWFGRVVPDQVGQDALRLTGPVVSNLLGVGALIVLLWAASIERLRRVTSLAPLAALVVMTLFVVGRAWNERVLLEDSIAAMAANVAVAGRWSTFWLVAPFLVVAALIGVRFSGQRLLAYPIATYPVAIFAFAFLRNGGYRAAPGDSGNRMLMHVVFIVIVFLVWAAGSGARAAEEKSEDGIALPTDEGVRGSIRQDTLP